MKRKRRKITPSKVLEKLADLSDEENTVEEDTVTRERTDKNQEKRKRSNEMTLEVYFGTYSDNENVECPRKYGLKVFPSRTFAEDMAALDVLRKTKRVRSNFIVIFENFAR